MSDITTISPSAGSRDRTIDVFLAIGIVMVVVGHKFQPPFLYFPAYAFHMALFFFASGYLAKLPENSSEKFAYLWRKTKSQLFVYFFCNVLFGLLTYFLATKGLVLGSVPSFGSPEEFQRTLYDFFVIPFVNGHQYALYVPAWFILQLYVVTVLFQVVCFSKRSFVIFSLYFAIFVSNFFFLKKGFISPPGDFALLVIRTMFGLFFYFTGFVVKSYGQKLGRILFSELFLIFCLVMVNIIYLEWGKGNIAYSIVFGNVGNKNVFVPLVTTTFIVFITLWLSRAIQGCLPEKSLFYFLSKNTFYIMIFHLPVFFIVNYIFFRLGYIEKKNLLDVYFSYRPEATWLLYEIPALIVPALLGSSLNKIRGSFAVGRLTGAAESFGKP